MTSIESSLEDSNIAEELAEQQRQISIAEFFEKNKQMLGFDSEARALVTTVKEAVDNSLDATEEAGIAPDIYIDIQEAGDYYRVIVEDNGPGITKDQIPNVFGKLLYGSRFHVREQSLPPDQQLLIRRDGEIDFIPIGVLCDAYLCSTDSAEQARVHDNISVPAFNRETHAMSWEPVTHAIRHETAEPTYEITTAGGRSVEVTGNHSLFRVNETGETVEVNAGDLEPGETILVPEQLPALDSPVSEVNLLTQLSHDQVVDESIYVRGLEPASLADLSDGGVPAQQPYRANTHSAGTLSATNNQTVGDSSASNAGVSGVCPASAVIEGGLEEQAVDCELILDINGERPVTIPVRCEISADLVEELAAYLATDAPDSVEMRATPSPRTADTTINRANKQSVSALAGRASPPASATQSALRNVVPLLCGQDPPDRQLPGFLFEAPKARQRQFLEALFTSGTTRSSDEWRHTTASETLARQLSVLWNMQGVIATMETAEGTAEGERASGVLYRVTVDADEACQDGGRSAAPPGTHGLEGTDMCRRRVVSVEETQPPEFVYDISVPGATGRDENFVVMNDGAISVKNSRGQQGIGISAAVLYAQLTSGKPARITSRTEGSSDANYFELIIDTESNEPEISADQATSWERTHGTRIEMEMEANMRARKQLLRYITHTAIVNPHARLTFDEPNLEEPLRFERAEDYDLPAETEEIRPHPHGVELGTLLKMLEATDSYSLSGFLQGEFTRVGGKTAGKVLDAFRDRHYGREMTWLPPPSGGRDELATAIENAVANKPADATAAFAERVTDGICGYDRVAHHAIVEQVDRIADEIESEFESTFGSTVRENAVAAAWSVLTQDLGGDVEALVDGATSSRKDSTTIEGLAERLAAKFEEREDGRHRLTRDELREFVRRSADDTEQFDDATIGETARENIVERFWAAMETVPDAPPKVRAIAANRDTASELLEAMRTTDIIAPPTDCLSPITAELIEAGLRKEFDADFYAAATREAEVHGGDPFIVEAGLAYGGELEEGSVDILRFANRVPLVYQRGACATTDVVKSINWRNYNLDQPGGSGIPDGPAVIMVHVASTNVPFTSESKDAVANIPAIEQEIERALREVGRDLKSYLNKRQSLQQRRKKQTVLATILPEMAKKVAEVTGRGELDIDDSMARIMNNVLVARDVENGTVRLSIQNYSDTNVSLEVTDIVSSEPADVEDATVVEMDGEWFVKWNPTISTDETAVLEYSANGDASFDLSVDGIENEKLTIQT